MTNIPQQKQVLEDIYNILSQIAVDVQPPENVAINTTDNIHTIQNFGYNLNPKHYGSYEYAISLKIGVDYNIKNLTATVLTAHLGNIFPKIIREVDKNANEKLHEAKKTENEELKEKLSQIKDITEPLNSELPEDKVIRGIFLIVNDCINKKVNPYKQALDEIEKKCSKYQTCIIVLKKDILDIINKAKEQ